MVIGLMGAGGGGVGIWQQVAQGQGEGALVAAAVVLSPWLQKAADRIAALAGKMLTPHLPSVSSLVHSAIGRWGLLSSSACADNIALQFPNMGDSAIGLVEDLCGNSTEPRAVENVRLTNNDVRGITEALEQNTVAGSLTLNYVIADTELLAAQFGQALIGNRNLNSLTLRVSDVNPTAWNPSPMTGAAFATIVRSLPYSQVTHLEAGFVELTASVARAFQATFSNATSPLQNMTFSWRNNPQPPDPQLIPIFQALGESPCITKLVLGRETSLSQQALLALLQAVGRSQTISSISMWCTSTYSFNATETAIALSVLDNPCFLGYSNILTPNIWFDCLPPAVAAAIQSATQNRAACQRNPACDTPLSPPTSAPTSGPTATPTSAPTGAPAPNSTAASSSSTAVAQNVTLPVAVSAAAIGAAAAVVLLIRRRRAHRDAEGLSSTDLGTLPLQMQNHERRLQQLEAGENRGGTGGLQGVAVQYGIQGAVAKAENTLNALRQENQAAQQASLAARAREGAAPLEEEDVTLVLGLPQQQPPVDVNAGADALLPEGGGLPEDTGRQGEA